MPSSPHPATLERFDGSAGPRKLGPQDGKFVDLAAVGVRFLAWAEETGGGCSIVEHPIPPRTLVAPLHKHSREDECADATADVLRCRAQDRPALIAESAGRGGSGSRCSGLGHLGKRSDCG